tara:strand:+ start:622 stop:765 length:144 start_codon:yes stop_codon:yes gene_type:complete
METIGIGIAGLGIFALVGIFLEKETNSGIVGISIALIALGYFIASFA